MRGNPKGWYTLPVEVVTNGTFLMLIGEPPDVDPLDDGHHCDSMGCRWSHVLTSRVLSDIEADALRHLIEGARATETPAEPKRSIREQVLARLGRVKDEEPRHEYE